MRTASIADVRSNLINRQAEPTGRPRQIRHLVIFDDAVDSRKILLIKTVNTPEHLDREYSASAIGNGVQELRTRIHKFAANVETPVPDAVWPSMGFVVPWFTVKHHRNHHLSSVDAS